MRATEAMKQISELIDAYTSGEIRMIRCLVRIAAVVGQYEESK